MDKDKTVEVGLAVISFLIALVWVKIQYDYTDFEKEYHTLVNAPLSVQLGMLFSSVFALWSIVKSNSLVVTYILGFIGLILGHHIGDYVLP
jgi:hypothetical protein